MDRLSPNRMDAKRLTPGVEFAIQLEGYAKYFTEPTPEWAAGGADA